MNYILDQVKDKLEAGLNGKVQYYFIGEPDIVSKDVASRGFICINPINDATELVETQTDQGIYGVEIVVSRDVRKEWNKQGDQLGPTKWLMDVVQDALPDGSLQSNTIKYILRNNLTDIGKVHDMNIEYDVKERNEQYTAEARISLSILTIRRLV